MTSSAPPPSPSSGPTASSIAQAAAQLRQGDLVAFPTETVYGLGANATDDQAVARIFEAKGRPRFDPIIVHLADPNELHSVTASVSDDARQLADAFWPGPLTMVLPRSDSIPPIVSAGLPTVGVRVPDHPIASQLIEMAGCPIAAPSGNRFGCISPTTAEHVREQLADRVQVILDGGPCRVGVESTVLDMTSDTPRLLRPGGVTREELEEVVGSVEVFEGAQPVDQAAPAPGMLARHYAPSTPVKLLAELPTTVPPCSGLLVFSTPEITDGWAHLEVLSRDGDLVEATAGFFAALHRLDGHNLQQIIALPFPNHGLGAALNNRLNRAATQAQS